jgi:predicted tellurium resistance membrane protein TerC
MKMLFSGDDEQFQPKIFVYRSLKKIMPSNHIDEEFFFVKDDILLLQPLFVALVVIEVMDVVLL